jgi:hypothetical protein
MAARPAHIATVTGRTAEGRPTPRAKVRDKRRAGAPGPLSRAGDGG